MAIAKDAFTSASNAYENTLSWSHTCAGSQRLLMVGVVTLADSPPPPDIVSLTYNGVALTKISGVSEGGVHVELWYLVNPPAGTYNIVITHDGTYNTGWCLGMATSYTGVDQTDPIQVFDVDVAESASVSTSLTPDEMNTMLVAVAGKYNVATGFSNMSGQVSDFANTGDPGWGLEGALGTKLLTTPGVSTIGYTYADSNDAALVGAALRPYVADSFEWKGETWWRRDNTGGGPTYNGEWRKGNVSDPDENDYITLYLTNPTGSKPIAAEFWSDIQGRGYGTYVSVIGTSLSTMHKSVVFGGMFTYGDSGVTNNEIDVHETSAWGVNANTVNLEHTYFVPDNGGKVGITNGTPIPSDAIQTHRLIWEPGKLTFDSFKGVGFDGELILHTERTADVPTPNDESVHYNLWVVDGDWVDVNPDGATPIAITIMDFSFTEYVPPGPPSFNPAIARRRALL